MKFKRLFVVLLAFIVLIFASCDQKRPEKGYISMERVDEIVKGYSATTDYSDYYVTGTLNYFVIPDDEIPGSVETDYKFKDSTEFFDLQTHINRV